MPRVSVLLPVYNADATIEIALRSILEQSYERFELLVCNDGSSDGSLVKCLDVAKDDPRVRVLTQENKGIANTLNRLIDEAKGEYLVRMDADDVAMQDRIKLQVEFLDKNPKCVAVGGAVQVIDEDGDPIGVLRRATDHDEILRGIIGEKSRSGHIVHPSVTLRASAVRKIGGYRPETVPAEDLDLWLRLAELGELANLGDLVLQYRTSSQGISQSRNLEQREKTFLVVREYRENRGMTWPPPRQLFKLEPSEPEKTFRIIRKCCASGNQKTAKKYLAKLRAGGHRSMYAKTLYFRSATPFLEVIWRKFDYAQRKLESVSHFFKSKCLSDEG